MPVNIPSYLQCIVTMSTVDCRQSTEMDYSDVEYMQAYLSKLFCLKL